MNDQEQNENIWAITIGLVDDHVLLRRGLATMLESKGLKVIVQADNGKQLISEWINEHAPQVMLVDVNMPMMDGYATATWLRKNYPGMRLLALSVIDDGEAIRKMIACGADGYVLKDSHPDALVHAIKTVYQKGFFLGETLSRQLFKQ
jgi:DNA-binding NarL/FixJ family response regulator